MVFSKFWKASTIVSLEILKKRRKLIASKVLVQSVNAKRKSSWWNYYIPPSQYDTPMPKRLNLLYALTRYWELIPLAFVTCVSLTLMTISIAAAPGQKVDVVYSTHNMETISRTMDLRCPYNVKWLTINQRYEPWPEMQDILDKMKVAEQKLARKVGACDMTRKFDRDDNK